MDEMRNGSASRGPAAIATDRSASGPPQWFVMRPLLDGADIHGKGFVRGLIVITGMAMNVEAITHDPDVAWRFAAAPAKRADGGPTLPGALAQDPVNPRSGLDVDPWRLRAVGQPDRPGFDSDAANAA